MKPYRHITNGTKGCAIAILFFLGACILAHTGLAATASPTDSAFKLDPKAPPVAIASDSRETRDFIGYYKQCMITTTRMERLSCYDEIAARMNLMPEAQKKKEDQILGTYGFWRAVFTTDDLGRGKTYLKLESSNAVKTSDGISVRPELIIACQAKKTDVYINWAFPLNNAMARKSLPVVFTIDNFPAVQQNWQLSSDNYAVYAPDAAKMIRAMRSHLKMVVTMTPVNQDTSTLTYDLPGLDNAIKILIDRCYADAPPAPTGPTLP